MTNASESDNNPLLYTVEDGVGILSFNRPNQHNALNQALSNAFRSQMAKAIADSEVRAILIRGEGKSFCSGKDVSELGVRDEGISDFAHISVSLEHKRRILDSQKPIIVAVRGYAIGAGCELALQSDIRIAGESSRFGLPEIKLGLMTDGGGTCITAAIAGPSRAKYMLMTGELVSGDLAMQWGLVDFLVPDDEVDDLALDIAIKIAAQPPVHVSVAKQLCDGVHGQEIRQGMANELVAISMLYKTEDHQEARNARREGRPPRFTGL